MSVACYGTAMADLLVAAGIVVDPKMVKRVVITIDANQAVTSTIEQYVGRDQLETIVQRLRVVEGEDVT